ncbi:pentapeptide repeat-containing protein [Streptomyces netropsis]
MTFSKCSLAEASFDRCDLSGACFGSCGMRRTEFEASPHQALELARAKPGEHLQEFTSV